MCLCLMGSGGCCSWNLVGCGGGSVDSHSVNRIIYDGLLHNYWALKNAETCILGNGQSMVCLFTVTHI